MKMKKSHTMYLLGLLIVVVSMAVFQTQSFAAGKAVKTSKERLVLMPLRLGEADKELQGAMEGALVEGLQQKYEVFSGELVAQKAHEIFLKESKTAHKECDETKCMQGIAEAFQSELIATANVTKRGDGYFLALSIQNIFDNKVVYSKSTPCKNCDAYQVVDKLKELSGALVQTATVTAAPAPVAPPQVSKGSNAEDKESLYWSSIKDSRNPDDFDLYLKAYPDGTFALLAKSRSAALKQAASEAAIPFKDNGNGTVTDNKASLMWQKDDDGRKRNWDDAISYCKGLFLAGHSDWRLPSKNELISLWENAGYKLEIGFGHNDRSAYFPSMQSSWYWSSTPLATNSAEFAGQVSFPDGTVYDNYKPSAYYVRCVRPGQ
jgi:Protein of unknown function (DUF1566)